MPITTEYVKGIVQPPYREKFGNTQSLRQNDDFSQILLHFQNNGSQMLVHEQGMGIVIEIHQGMDENGHQLEVCRTECYELTPTQRMELAVYLLSTIRVRGE
jgi:hypothetical protein